MSRSTGSLKKRQKRPPRLQRWVQGATLLLFVLLIWQTMWPFAGWLVRWLPPDSFLRLDPAGMLISGLSTRAWITGGIAMLLALLATAIIGRFFCGMLCPMGTTIDAVERLLYGPTTTRKYRLQAGSSASPRLSRLKYYLLIFLLAAATMGVSFVFLLAPIPLVTRLYALLLHPVLLALGDHVLNMTRPALDALGMTSLYYTQLQTPRFATQLFTIAFFAGIFACGLLAPRFWCRNLCPAGALFALFSRRPLLRRQVAETCIQCGACQRQCPMGAIPEDPFLTSHAECIICQRCTQICPVQAIDFRLATAPQQNASSPTHQPARRAFLFAGVLWAGGGIGGAMAAVTGLTSPHVPEGKGSVAPPDVIRPPGALPENDFLARCVRCGECMKACPTNTLQPIGLEFGVSGLFSPTLVPRRGPCEPTCRACGLVCPTGALRTLPSQAEKVHAKLGTARVLRYKCLAWEHGRKCLVCDEVCPFDAIELIRAPGIDAPVPIVHENRCAGCGFCEFNCPVREQRAIVIEPMGALRLASGSYEETATAAGLELSLVGHKQSAPQQTGYPGEYGSPDTQGYPQTKEYPEGQGGYAAPNQNEQGLPPGFTAPETSEQQNEGALPPGFSDPDE